MTEIKVRNGYIIKIPIKSDLEDKKYRNLLKNFNMKASYQMKKHYENVEISSSSISMERYLHITFFNDEDAILFKLIHVGI